MSLLDELSTELQGFISTGLNSIQGLLDESDTFLAALKDIRTELESEISAGGNHDHQYGDSQGDLTKPYNQYDTEITKKEAASQSIHDSNKTNLDQLYSNSNYQLTSDPQLDFNFQVASNSPLKSNSLNRSSQVLQGNSFDSLDKLSSKWYKNSIAHLKSYNSGINKFLKNVLNNLAFNINLDDAYTFPLSVSSIPGAQFAAENQKAGTLGENKRDLLIKSIILHLLKSGQCDVVNAVLKEMSCEVDINKEYLSKFEYLKSVVDDVTNRHDLTKALEWFRAKYNASKGYDKEDIDGDKITGEASDGFAVRSFDNTELLLYETQTYNEVELRFHLLQFVLLLNGKGKFSLQNSINAYMYAKDNFMKFFEDHLDIIAPLITLLVVQTEGSNSTDTFQRKHVNSMMQEFFNKLKSDFRFLHSISDSTVTRYVYELLNNFEEINNKQALFVDLANDFILEFCKDLRLSNDSSLFRSMLAGFIYLPSFYKYRKIQMRMQRLSFSAEDAPEQGKKIVDLPFQLPDAHRFLFNFHSIFICPISKEQLVPLTSDKPPSLKRKKSNDHVGAEHMIGKSPLVVLNLCHHVALRESVWQLSNKGMDMFKCHYCYKNHKYTDVSDAYFIDI